jgi:hypothetical protein
MSGSLSNRTMRDIASCDGRSIRENPLIPVEVHISSHEKIESVVVGNSCACNGIYYRFHNTRDNMIKAHFVSLILLSEGYLTTATTCYTSDTAILGTGNIVIHNILNCASKASTKATGSITTCMEQTYPAYAAVSESCLECTTSVIDTSSGLQCLVSCLGDMTTSNCTSCTPTLSSSWTSTCDRGQTPPNPSSSAELPTCSADDINTLPSASHFVTNSLNCLTNLSTFTSCLESNVPYYNSISASCKICAEAQTTPNGITADGCGAICMQQPVGSNECSKCGSDLSSLFSTNCLGGQKSSHILSTSVLALSILITLLIAW